MQSTDDSWFKIDKPLVIEKLADDVVANAMQSLNPPPPFSHRMVKKETLLEQLHSATDLLLRTNKFSQNQTRYFRNWLKALEGVVNTLKNKVESNQQPVPVAAS